MVMWNCGNWMEGIPFGVGRFFMWAGPFGGVLGLLFFLLIIYLIFKIIKSFIPETNAATDKYDSLGILKTRLAKGDISQEEYHRMREMLLR
jgi:putative membrane protein